MGQQPQRAEPFLRGVIEVEPSRIAALASFDLLPRLPEKITARGNTGALQDPPPDYIASLHWYVSGDPYRPSAIMALRERYHFGYARTIIEIEHVAGCRTGVVKLLKQATVLACFHGMLLSGETDSCNFEMLDVGRRMGFMRDRTRVVWPEK